MKVANTIIKILTALATVAGVVYIVATYGEQIVAWAKKMLNAMPKCPACEETCEEEIEIEFETAAEEVAEEPAEEVAAEEPAPEVVVSEEEFVPEVVVADNEPVAEEHEFAE